MDVQEESILVVLGKKIRRLKRRATRERKRRDGALGPHTDPPGHRGGTTHGRARLHRVSCIVGEHLRDATVVLVGYIQIKEWDAAGTSRLAS